MRGLTPSLFLYINCGSQGSDLGDRELRKGYLGPIGTPPSYFWHTLSYFPLYHSIFPSYFRTYPISIVPSNVVQF